MAIDNINYDHFDYFFQDNEIDVLDRLFMDETSDSDGYFDRLLQDIDNESEDFDRFVQSLQNHEYNQQDINSYVDNDQDELEIFLQQLQNDTTTTNELTQEITENESEDIETLQNQQLQQPLQNDETQELTFTDDKTINQDGERVSKRTYSLICTDVETNEQILSITFSDRKKQKLTITFD